MVGVTPAMTEGAVIQPTLKVRHRGKVKPDAQISLRAVDLEKPGGEKALVAAAITCRTMFGETSSNPGPGQIGMVWRASLSLGDRGVKSNRALFQHDGNKVFFDRVVSICAYDVEEMLFCGFGDDLQVKWPALLTPMPIAAEEIVKHR